MAHKVTTFRSRNLFGETRREEKNRQTSFAVQGILSGKSRVQVRRERFFGGTTEEQKRARRGILSKAGISAREQNQRRVFR